MSEVARRAHIIVITTVWVPLRLPCIVFRKKKSVNLSIYGSGCIQPIWLTALQVYGHVHLLTTIIDASIDIFIHISWDTVSYPGQLQTCKYVLFCAVFGALSLPV